MTNRQNTGEQALLDQTGRLPRTIDPTRDLWPGIERQLGEQLDEQDSAAAPVSGATGVTFLHGWQARAALAASLLLAVFIGYGIGREVTTAPAIEAVATLSAASGSDIQPVNLVEEVGLLEARRTMAAEIQAGLGRLPPEARTVVVDNLRTINKALDEIDAVLADSPGGGLDRQLLVSMYADQLARLSSMQTLVMNSNQEILL